MSSQGSPTLILELPRLRSECLLGVALIVLAVAAPLLLIDDMTGLAIVALVAVLLTASFRRAGWLGGPHALIRTTWRSDGVWRLTRSGGEECDAQLLPSSRMSPVAIWLRWESDDPSIRGRALLVLARDVPAGDFRRLLVRLRLDRSQFAPAAN